MTTMDKTGASDAEFRARVAAFDAAPTPVECDPEQVETVARALAESDGEIANAGVDVWGCLSEPSRDEYRRLAAAAIAARPPSPAEEAVKRVEAMIAFYDRHEYSVLNVDDIRAALASPAPAPQGEEG